MTFILPSIGGGIIASPTAPPAWNNNSYSVSFDGVDDFVSTSSFDLTSNKTVSYWINLDSISSAGIYLFGKGASYFSYLTANGQTLYIYDGSSVGTFTLGSSNAITTGSWIHIAITGNGTTAKLYKNGAFIDDTGDVTPTGMDRFAGDSVGGSRFVDGLMDEVAVWDAELSADDITSIYNSGAPNDLSDASSYDTDRSSNLVHWWRMGENNSGSGTTITDQGSGGNDGTLTNGPTFSTTVPLGPLVLPSITNTYAISFDGSNDYADCGVLTELHGASTMSLSFWFKSDTSGEGPSMGSRTGSTNQWGFLRAGSANYVQIVTGGAGKYFSYSSPADTNYHHYLLTFSSGSINFYIDGAAVSVSLLNIGNGSVPTLHSESVSFDLGRNATFYSHGLMDEVALFSTVLSQREVTAIYNSGTPNDISSLSPLGWWRNGDNDSGTGTTVTDQGSGSHDGTLTNGPTFSTTVP
jgi:hypothetical protein